MKIFVLVNKWICLGKVNLAQKSLIQNPREETSVFTLTQIYYKNTQPTAQVILWNEAAYFSPSHLNNWVNLSIN